MSSINKTSVLSQFSSALAALNVSTAGTESLVMYLKSALNAEVSANTIISELTSRVNDVTGSDELKEIVLLAVATSLITEDRVITVPDLTTLSGMTNAIAGTVFFVESEGFPYVRKSNGDWVLIDASLQKAPLENAWSWGNNIHGQLGDNTTVAKSSPVSVTGWVTDWTQVSAGAGHSLGLRANGTTWAWGLNSNGQLGAASGAASSVSPISVVGNFTDWIQVSAGGNHSLGLKSNGTVWAWGSNGDGRLGDNTIVGKTSPVSIVGTTNDWVQLSAGDRHNVGLKSDGTAWAWGHGANGKLGNNASTNRSSPVLVVGGFVNWVQVAAGGDHSLGLRADGTAWGWGTASNGALGNDSSYGNRSSPVSVIGGFTDWVQLSAGYGHSIGLRANGTAWAWGRNTVGQLGDNTLTIKLSPVSVVGGFADWVQMSAGTQHTLGVRANGQAWAWGNNTYAQLGDNTTSNRSSPVSVVGGFVDCVQVAAGRNHSIALRGS